MIATTLLSLALATTVSSSASTGSPDSATALTEHVEPGMRIRLTAPTIKKRRVTGKVVSMTDTRLVVKNDNDEEILIPRRAVATLEQSLGGSSKGEGAVKGALVGLGLAAVLGVVVGEDCAHSQSFVCFDRPTTAVIMSVLTVPTGAIVGAIRAKGEKWAPLGGSDRVSLQVGGDRGRAGLRLALRF